tara:strand:+ start:777 stop:1424 length:648 start_codon:yes stop_codon:yes gene_type:complete
MNTYYLLRIAVIATLVFLIPNITLADAYCALRDPTAAIHQLYPSASSFRSVVRMVDNDVRVQVNERLPFTLHYEELGEHTLYIAMLDIDRLGIVHMRSEATKWGLMETAWSLGFDLKVKDLFIQRCRIKDCKNATLEDIKASVIGKSFDEVKAMLNEDGSAIVFDEKYSELRNSLIALPIIRSALKTILVTELVWNDELNIADIDPMYSSLLSVE